MVKILTMLLLLGAIICCSLNATATYAEEKTDVKKYTSDEPPMKIRDQIIHLSKATTLTPKITGKNKFPIIIQGDSNVVIIDAQTWYVMNAADGEPSRKAGKPLAKSEAAGIRTKTKNCEERLVYYNETNRRWFAGLRGGGFGE